MNHGSLFSGIGGFDLAAEWMGWNNKFHCEWNEFGQRVLKYYWPNAMTYEDITKTDFTIWRGRIDVLTGGFPCQPYSMAGKRLGKEDERHLWPEMLRAIREIQPTWVVGENVLGLVNWNGGLVFDEVQADLEAQGYEVQPYVLPACAVNAPHRRDRVWFVAYSNGVTTRPSGTSSGNAGQRSKEFFQQGKRRQQTEQHTGCGDVFRPTSNTSSESSEWVRPEQREISEQEQGQPRGTRSQVGDGEHASNSERSGRGKILHDIQRKESNGAFSDTTHEQTNWQEFPTVSPICHGDDGISERLDGITFSKWRAESVKAAGNAIVPQVALQIFKAIQQYEGQC